MLQFERNRPTSEASQIWSSVWCNGRNHVLRKCRFRNLCYKRDTNDYLFVKQERKSIESGLPEDRFKPSLCELSSIEDHNKYYFNYVELPFRHFQTLIANYNYTLRFVENRTFIFGRFKPDNLMHLLHDDIIPLFATLLEFDLSDNFHLLIDDQWPSHSDSLLKFSDEIYAKLFRMKSIIFVNELNDKDIICFESAFVGLNRNTIWYNYGFHEPQKPIYRSPNERESLQNIVHLIFSKLIDNYTICAEKYVTLLSRTSTRLILNENELLDLLIKSSHLKVLKVNVEDFHSFSELLYKVHCSSVLIGVHGSALILSLFMLPNSALVEIFPFGINNDHYTPYKTLAEYMNINYYFWRNMIKSNSISHPEYPPELGGIQHLPISAQSVIKSNTADVPQHLCCTDPLWLYHIYQDTFIDTISFKKVLYRVFNKPEELNNKEVIFYPSAVLNLKCSRRRIRVDITWDMPWNTVFLPSETKLKFEVLVKFNNDSAAAFYTSTKHMTLEVIEGDSVIIWVRCYADSFKGPFPKEPIYC
ncbi:protein O-linked-mannose beta-1:4-N-acetylglucosaminyltransferase 2-like protein [Dinothrombium tinctorium]|uniref:Protein O-linked-mannose beta-1:4-N-acetylglucosaminyltransferase 2-like protein n=1 Tax=Dinothrombium tinctorium TaxID=1965070 RepID=A0A443R5A6_9ACAR|nr:protein O-linked-mannose beta-1:4-N-acetylglucosaminyltransferase 2-like protein [Dinothrombium tinctorium]